MFLWGNNSEDIGNSTDLTGSLELGKGGSGSDEIASWVDNEYARSIYPKKGIAKRPYYTSVEKLYLYLVQVLISENSKATNNIHHLLKHHEMYHKHARHVRPAIMGRFLPTKRSIGSPLCTIDYRIFCGIFSKSGNTYMTASQDSCIRLYDASRLVQWSSSCHKCLPRRQEILAASLPPYRTIYCHHVGWSIVSTDFSPDEKWVAYSTWSHFVHLCNTSGSHVIHEPHNFLPGEDNHLLCLFSIQFSPRSGSHILAGGSDQFVYLYSLEQKKVVFRMKEHMGDVNATAYLDETGQTFVSGSDDSLIKVWDERDGSMKAVGTLVGHNSGITCLNSKVDGRYIISNSKDQSLKLWDVRRMSDNSGVEVKKALKRLYTFDYRSRNGIESSIVPRVLQTWRKPSKGKLDSSISTFYGHSVLQTLIRCQFSPMYSTGQRYVLSGSSCGRMFMWDTLSGSCVVCDPPHEATVRDISWHPHAPILASASWYVRLHGSPLTENSRIWKPAAACVIQSFGKDFRCHTRRH